MELELENLPIIDWKLAIKLAGNQKALATDIHNMLMSNLHADLTAIKQLHQSKNYADLLLQIHKLHGALCYCGLPRLKAIVACLENELKNKNTTHLCTLINRLDNETNLLLEHYPNHPA